MTSMSVPTLVRETKASESSVYRALAWLKRNGYLQDVAEEDVPEWRKMYPSVTRRITEREHWGTGKPLPDYRPSVEIVAIFGASDENPTVKMTPPSEQGNLESEDEGGVKMTPSIKTKNIKSSPTEMYRRSRVHSETRSFGQRNLVREEDDLDPTKTLFPEDHQQPARSGSREPGPDTGMGLALHFSRELTKTGSWKFPDLANRQALARSFNAWKKSGVTADEIRTMINIYCSRPDFRDPKKTPWVDFLAQRALLGAERNAESLRALHRPENFNPEDWTSQRGSESSTGTEKSDADYEFDYEKWKRGQG
jgi:hypothetical protein